MILHRRRNGSQRVMAPIKLTIWPNIGDTEITFRDQEGTWYRLEPESDEEMKKLLSEVHTVYHNWR